MNLIVVFTDLFTNFKTLSPYTGEGFGSFRATISNLNAILCWILFCFFCTLEWNAGWKLETALLHLIYDHVPVADQRSISTGIFVSSITPVTGSSPSEPFISSSPHFLCLRYCVYALHPFYASVLIFVEMVTSILEDSTWRRDLNHHHWQGPRVTWIGSRFAWRLVTVTL